jgi:hypothetical protein
MQFAPSANAIASRLYRQRRRLDPLSIRQRYTATELAALALKPHAELTSREKRALRNHRYEQKVAILAAAELAASFVAPPKSIADEPVQAAEPAAASPIGIADEVQPMEFDDECGAARPFGDDEPMGIAADPIAAEPIAAEPRAAEPIAAAPIAPTTEPIAAPIAQTTFALCADPPALRRLKWRDLAVLHQQQCAHAAQSGREVLMRELYRLMRAERTQLVLSRGEDTDHIIRRSSIASATPARRTTRSHTEAATATATASSAPSSSLPSEPNKYSIGYAGAGQASFQRVLDFLCSGVPGELQLTKESQFLDIGSGAGHCVMHARIATQANVTGIEVVKARYREAVVIWKHLRATAQFSHIHPKDNGVAFVHGNIVEDEHRHLIDRATHIWMFDPVFHPETHEGLLPLLAQGHTRVVVTCLAPGKLNERWRGPGDSTRAFQELGCTVRVDTDGGQSFRVYTYRTQDPDAA